MNKRLFCYLCFTIIVAFPCLSLNAQKQGAEDRSSAVSDAVNPLAFITKLQIQPNFTWKAADAKLINLTTRIIQPTASIVLPFIKSKNPSDMYTIYRLELPLIGQSFPANKALDGVGLSDISIADIVVFKKKFGLLGVGPSLIIPSMNPEQVSSRKWSAGLGTVYFNTRTKGFMWGALLQQFFNIGGDMSRPNQNFMLVQPIVNKIFSGGRFISFGSIFNFNWTKNEYAFPLGINYGQAFAKNLSILIGPEYMLSGPNKDDITFRFQINTMFPPSKK
jgi:hypothetical protein